MDNYIFDEQDELDSVLLCSTEREYNNLLEEYDKPLSVMEDYVAQKAIDCLDIDKDEADVSPIGMEAEEIIDADAELFLGDEEDNELIDLVGGL